MALSLRTQRRLVLLLAAGCLACATAPRVGDEVHVAEESAIIIWDAASKTQHFVRRASFETKAKDFGFLVPTPTVPKIEGASEQAFVQLVRLTEPREVLRSAGAPRPAPAAAPAQVVVVATAKVAGYEAAVLKAADAGALDRWLKANGYASSPELLDWYKPYVAQQWLITAFKISKDKPEAGRVQATAIRMSFRTEQPFFPYREPARSGPRDARPRLLRVFLLAESRYDAGIGSTKKWPGLTPWSDRIPQDELAILIEKLELPKGTAAKSSWLTEFEDPSSVRPGRDDLFFFPAPRQMPTHR
jgi:hypothetical protein